MIDNIITLIIAEAKAGDIPSLPQALGDLMVNLNRIIQYKIADIEKVFAMEISDDEKERIIEMILQAD